MHLLGQHPPMVCRNDPLRILRPDREANGLVCKDYKLFSFNPLFNGTQCAYTPGDKVDPVSGAAFGSCEAIPAPGGWGLENSHFVNWLRISAYKDFRKLFGRINGETWKKGDQKTIFVANRMDVATVAGEHSEIKKRLHIQTASTYGGQNDVISVIFLITAVFSGVLALGIIHWHNQNPRRLEDVITLGW